MAMPIESKFNL